MDDLDQTIDPHPEGQGSTPDDEGGLPDEDLSAVLAKRFGREEFNLDDLGTYLDDADTWNKQQNLHNERIANAATEAEKERDRVLREMGQTLQSLQQGQQPQISPQQAREGWMRRLGIENGNEPISFDQFFDAMASTSQAMDAQLAGLARAQQAQEQKFEQLSSDAQLALVNTGQQVAKDFIGDVMTKYSDADEDALWRIVNSPPSDGDVEGAIQAEAKRTHDLYRSRLGDVSRTEGQRRALSRKPSAAGRSSGGGPVAGKKAPNIFTEEGLDAFMEENPRQSGDDAV